MNSHLRDLDGDDRILGLPVALAADAEEQGVAGFLLVQDGVPMLLGGHDLPVDLEDDVAGLEAFAGGVAAAVDFGDEEALAWSGCRSAGRGWASGR